MNNTRNLNYSIMDVADASEDSMVLDHSVKSADIEVFFRDIKEVLCKKIQKSKIIVGCVAWLTDTDILKSLAKTKASIIVQKEDFLRPDSVDDGKDNLRKLYAKIESNCERYSFENTVLPKMSYCGDPCLGGIRCVGNHNKDKNPAHPRMHNKFLVFCKWKRGINGCRVVVPESVWTGSFNFTYNAGNSFENEILINNKEIAMAYFKEYAQIAALSEPLEWESEWMAPEWRIGS